MTEERTSAAPRPRRRSSAEAQEPARRTGDERGTAANDREGAESEARTRPHNGGRVTATTAARRAARAVAELTGHDVETVISIEPCDDGWNVGVEVVETRRIPDSADILASYEVRLDSAGDLCPIGAPIATHADNCTEPGDDRGRNSRSGSCPTA